MLVVRSRWTKKAGWGDLGLSGVTCTWDAFFWGGNVERQFVSPIWRQTHQAAPLGSWRHLLGSLLHQQGLNSSIRFPVPTFKRLESSVNPTTQGAHFFPESTTSPRPQAPKRPKLERAPAPSTPSADFVSKRLWLQRTTGPAMRARARSRG